MRCAIFARYASRTAHPGCLWRGDEAFTRADVIAGARDFDADRVPAPIFGPLRGVADVVLLRQFVGDVRRRRLEVARRADDFSTPAAVVGDVAQRPDVDAFTADRHPVARAA